MILTRSQLRRVLLLAAVGAIAARWGAGTWTQGWVPPSVVTLWTLQLTLVALSVYALRFRRLLQGRVAASLAAGMVFHGACGAFLLAGVLNQSLDAWVIQTLRVLVLSGYCVAGFALSGIRASSDLAFEPAPAPKPRGTRRVAPWV